MPQTRPSRVQRPFEGLGGLCGNWSVFFPTAFPAFGILHFAMSATKRRQPGDGKAAEEKKQAAKDKKAVEDIEVKALLALMQIVKRPLTPPSPAWRWYPGGKRAVTSSD